MPWTAADAARHKQGLSPEDAAKWAKVANAALATCEAKGGKDCEGYAIRVANSQVAKGDWQREFAIRKTDTDQRLVFGWLSVAVDKAGNVIEDHQGDVIPPEELEKAAYEYVLYARKAGEMHEKIGVGDLVESMIFTLEKQAALGIPEGVLPVGWWVGYHLSDDKTWQKVKDGTYTAFSIGGHGVREVLDEANGKEVTG